MASNNNSMTPADWIEWSGGECPVAADTLVQIRYRDGKGADWPPMHASFWVHDDPTQDSWVGTSCGAQSSYADIAAYRVIQP